jgi:hypothetical protein
MTRKVDEEKYKRILQRLAQGETQKSIIAAEKCSYGTISAAKHWEKTWRSTQFSTSKITTNMTKIVLLMPNFWLDCLNEDIEAGIWTDYSDAVLDIIRTYFRTRYEDVNPESRKSLGLRRKILGELKGVIGSVEDGYTIPSKNLQQLHTDSYLEKREKQDKDKSMDTQEEGQRIQSKLEMFQDSDEMIFKNYHGKPLVQEEYDVLMELEQQVGEIPRLEVDNILEIHGSDFDESVRNFNYVIFGNHIIKLTIQEKGLTSVPESIHQLKFLNRLDLRNNKLTELPETIQQLQYLEELILDINNLTAIPEWIGNLKLLGVIGLANNNIASVDKKWLNRDFVYLTGNPCMEDK